MIRVNPNWIKNQITVYKETGKIDATTNFNKAMQELVMILESRHIGFKIYNVGAGVKRLVTDTNICPTCKRKF